jgi:hypothetical protein
MVEIKGKCKDEKREISIAEGPYCIVRNGTDELSYEEDCSVSADLMESWAIIAGLIALAMLCALFCTFIFCFCRFRKKY